MRLNLAEWASVAEIVGAAAVIVSLVYVGYQVNDNTSAIRSAAANDASVAMQSWYLEMGSHREASDLWFNAMTSLYRRNHIFDQTSSRLCCCAELPST